MTTATAGPVGTRSAQEVVRRLSACLAAELADDVLLDDDGRVREVVDAGRRWRYRYDARGDLVRVDAPDGTTGYHYDALRRLVLVEHPDGGSTRYEYDGDDRLASVVDRGRTSTWRYDARGRLVGASHGADVERSYRYDAHGRLVVGTAGGVRTEHVLDAQDRLVGVRQSVAGEVAEVALRYDGAGRLAAVLPARGPVLGLTWDRGARPAQVTVDGCPVADLAYDDGRRTVRTRFANGVVEETTADPVDGRVLRRRVTRAGTTLLARDCTYDEAGRLVDDGARRYTYDAAARLVGVAPSGQAPEDGEATTSDRWGRVTSVRADGSERVLRYDGAGQLVQVRSDGVVTAQLTYDHKGRLVQVRAGDQVERYVLGLADEVLVVTDEAGRPVRVPVRTPFGVVAEAVAADDGWVVHSLHGTGHGTVGLVTGPDGSVLAEPDLDPWGRPAQEPRAGATAERPVFAGRPRVPGTGLHCFGARWYDPRLRRFLSPDTWTAGPDDERLVHPAVLGRSQAAARAEQLDGWLRRPRLRDRYAYCGDDPVNRADPSGHWSFGGVVLSLLGAVWTLPNTLAGLVVELSCLAAEVVRWLAWAVTGGRVSWEPPGFDVAASGRLNAFAVVFRGGWLGSIPSLLGITFGNVFFVHGRWEDHPDYAAPGDVLPEAYGGTVRLARSRILYEHELRHTAQYGWLGPFFHVGLPVFGFYEWDVILHGYQDAWTERDARRHSEGPPAVPAPTSPAPGAVVVRSARTGSPLAGVWVYWRAGTTSLVLRTAEDGALRSTEVAGSTAPWDYTTAFAAPAGADVQLAVSYGSRPLPAEIVGLPGLLTPGSVTAGTPGPATVDVDEPSAGVDLPEELGLWPVLRDLPTEEQATSGLPQGTAAWTSAQASGTLVVTEGSASPPPADARPTPRRLRVTGRVDAAATAAEVALFTAAGARVPLAGPTAADPPVDAVDVVLDAARGADRPFTADLLPADLTAAFGPLQLVLVVHAPTGVQAQSVSVHLCGLQAALVDDPAPGQAGAAPDEDDDVVVVDFAASPQASRPLLTAQTRLRRMVRYSTATTRRPLAAGGPAVPQPRMPLWTGELQLVGVTAADLQDLLHRRAHRRDVGRGAPGGPSTTRLTFRWGLRLSWDGPDAASGAFGPPFPRPAQHSAYRLDLPLQAQEVTATLSYDRDGRLTAPDGTPVSGPAGTSVGLVTPAPPAVTGRRTPTVRTGPRTWGRARGAALPSLVVEFQPQVVDASGAQVVRGGDGVLEVHDVRLDGRPVDAGASAAAAPAGQALLRLPSFRVNGGNPTVPDVEETVRALVGEHVDRHQSSAAVQALTRQCWETTVLKIFRHESGHRYHQFDDRGAARRAFSRGSGTWWFGTEDGMPLFGPPHGYGVCQLDSFGSPPRGANDDEVWSWLENLRTGVRVVLAEKAAGAWALVQPHAPTPLDRATRAAFQRETVRRYNGGSEIVWTSAGWAVSPSLTWADSQDHGKGPHPNLLYTNRVLGTAVVYYRDGAGAPNTGGGAATQFEYPPPIPLLPAHYPPETAP